MKVKAAPSASSGTKEPLTAASSSPTRATVNVMPLPSTSRTWSAAPSTACTKLSPVKLVDTSVSDGASSWPSRGTPETAASKLFAASPCETIAICVISVSKPLPIAPLAIVADIASAVASTISA